MGKNKKSKKTEREVQDEKRMITSGAEEAGYHAPTDDDVQDIRKDHDAATTGISADEAIRQVHGTAEKALNPEEGKGAQRDEELAS